MDHGEWVSGWVCPRKAVYWSMPCPACLAQVSLSNSRLLFQTSPHRALARERGLPLPAVTARPRAALRNGSTKRLHVTWFIESPSCPTSICANACAPGGPQGSVTVFSEPCRKASSPPLRHPSPSSTDSGSPGSGLPPPPHPPIFAFLCPPAPQEHAHCAQLAPHGRAEQAVSHCSAQRTPHRGPLV